MDTNDLKRLFEEQDGTSRLTSDGVTRHVERQRSLRRAGVAGIVSLAVVGVAMGGLWLNNEWNNAPIPASPEPIVTVSPEPSGDPTAPATEIGGSLRAPASEVACTVDAPSSWAELIDKAGELKSLDGPWIQKDENTLIWHKDGKAMQFATDADFMYGGGETDGRYVLYLAGGEAKVWDSQNPSEPAWALPGVFGGDGPNLARLDEGKVWMMLHTPDLVSDPVGDDLITDVSVIDLGKGREPRKILTTKDLFALTPFGGGLLSRIGDGPFQILQPDGTFTDAPEAFREVIFLGEATTPAGTAILVAAEPEFPDNRARVLLNGVSSPVINGWVIDGEWVMGTTVEGAAADYAMYNYLTGVSVNLPATEGTFTLRDGYLWVSQEGMANYAPVALSALPEVTCG
ncbi:MAG: hypothetical protein Q4G35_04215 [Propionibacteriaceae bacterium]|nr:hypothetical protein [Propionibacteriaceae bacterium]